MRGGAVFGYGGTDLTIEYRIPFSAFNRAGMEATAAPADGTVWGVQPCISNQLSANSSESVNWEPDTVGSYVYGEPFGALRFVRPAATVGDWMIY